MIDARPIIALLLTLSLLGCYPISPILGHGAEVVSVTGRSTEIGSSGIIGDGDFTLPYFVAIESSLAGSNGQWDTGLAGLDFYASFMWQFMGQARGVEPKNFAAALNCGLTSDTFANGSLFCGIISSQRFEEKVFYLAYRKHYLYSQTGSGNETYERDIVFIGMEFSKTISAEIFCSWPARALSNSSEVPEELFGFNVIKWKY